MSNLHIWWECFWLPANTVVTMIKSKSYFMLHAWCKTLLSSGVCGTKCTNNVWLNLEISYQYTWPIDSFCWNNQMHFHTLYNAQQQIEVRMLGVTYFRHLRALFRTVNLWSINKMWVKFRSKKSAVNHSRWVKLVIDNLWFMYHWFDWTIYISFKLCWCHVIVQKWVNDWYWY